MPRSGAAALRFDAGFDWTDPQSREDHQRELAYYDWSLDEDFAEPRRLRAVADPEVSERPRRRTVAERPRPRRAAASTPRLTAAPAGLTEALPREPDPIIDAVEAPVIDPQTGRRTITITGRGAERAGPSRRPGVLPAERVRYKPDRIAMWAVLLCVLMIVAAATSAHAAVIH